MVVINKKEKEIEKRRKLIKRIVHFNQTYNPVELKLKIEEERKKNKVMLERIKDKEV